MSVLNGLPPRIVRATPLAILFAAFVDEEGKVRECTVLAVFGDERAGRELCKELTGKRMRRGTGPEGEAIAGVIRSQIAVSETASGPNIPTDVLRPDLELQVSALPTGAADLVDVVVLVGEGGAVEQCVGAEEKDPQLVSVACAQAGRLSLPIRELEQKPVRYLLPLSVKFRVTQAAPESELP